MTTQYDVIVVGLGPAGSTAARHLALAGRNVLGIDRTEFPREKPCGNLIAGSAQQHLDFKLPAEIVRGECLGAEVYLPGGQYISFHLPFPIASYVYRSDFDAYLLQQAKIAGAYLSLGRKIESISEKADRVVVRMSSGEEYTAQYLIGADGATGMTSKVVRGRKYRRWELGVSIFEMYSTSRPGAKRYENRDTLVLDLNVVPGGYAWVMPQGEYLNLGMGGPVLFVKNPRSFIKTALRRFGLDTDGLFKAHPLPAGGIPRKLRSPRVLLVGDAAGLVDTISGDGITNAIHSGRLAAKAITEGWTADSPRVVSDRYVKSVRRQILPDLRASLVYNGVLLAFRWFFRRLRPEDSTLLFERLFTVIGGRDRYRTYVRWVLLHLPLMFARGLAQRRARKGAHPTRT